MLSVIKKIINSFFENLKLDLQKKVNTKKKRKESKNVFYPTYSASSEHQDPRLHLWIRQWRIHSTGLATPRLLGKD
tara:strand:+ start:1266 stop:1493 length:228 start_codon:yes stop_codon:yes gene_type:complete